MICQGGCLRIMKILYSCREQRNSNLLQLELVRRRCEKKEKCMVSSSRDMFGYDECRDAPDEEMNMWIVYRCDGGQDKTRVTGTKECNTRITREVTPSPWCGFCKRMKPDYQLAAKEMKGKSLKSLNPYNLFVQVQIF